MFQQGMAEAREGVVILDHLDPRVFSVLIRFLYTGQYTPDHTPDIDLDSTLLGPAHTYGVSALQAILEEALCKRPLLVGGCLERLLLAETYGLERLRDLCVRHLRSNLAAARAHSAFARLSPATREALEASAVQWWDRPEILVFLLVIWCLIFCVVR